MAIETKDSLLAAWSTNFNDRITASPATYNFSAPEAVAYSASMSCSSPRITRCVDRRQIRITSFQACNCRLNRGQSLIRCLAGEVLAYV